MNIYDYMDSKAGEYNKFDPTRVRRLWALLQPHIHLKCYKIHIIGTNGKGSTGRFIAQSLRENGARVLESKMLDSKNLQNLDSKDSTKITESNLNNSKILDSKQDSKISQNIESKSLDSKNLQNLDSKDSTKENENIDSNLKDSINITESALKDSKNSKQIQITESTKDSINLDSKEITESKFKDSNLRSACRPFANQNIKSTLQNSTHSQNLDSKDSTNKIAVGLDAKNSKQIQNIESNLQDSKYSKILDSKGITESALKVSTNLDSKQDSKITKNMESTLKDSANLQNIESKSRDSKVSTKFTDSKSAKKARVLHFISPHLFEFRDRFFINDDSVSLSELQRAHEYLQGFPFINEASYFEYATFLALVMARDCDYLVMEAGVGGEYDSTSVLCYDATIFTKIGIDHKDLLGDTLHDIALTKLKAAQGAIFTHFQEPLVLEMLSRLENIATPSGDFTIVDSKDSINLDSKITQNTESKFEDSTKSQKLDSKTQGNSPKSFTYNLISHPPTLLENKSETFGRISTSQTSQTSQTDSIESKTQDSKNENEITESSLKNSINLDSKNAQNIESNLQDSKTTQKVESKSLDSKLQNLDFKENIESTLKDSKNSKQIQNIESKSQDSKNSKKFNITYLSADDVEKPEIIAYAARFKIPHFLQENLALANLFLESINVKLLDSKLNLRGRCEVLKPNLIIDVGHNEMAAHAVLSQAKEYFCARENIESKSQDSINLQNLDSKIQGNSPKSFTYNSISHPPTLLENTSETFGRISTTQTTQTDSIESKTQDSKNKNEITESKFKDSKNLQNPDSKDSKTQTPVRDDKSKITESKTQDFKNKNENTESSLKNSINLDSKNAQNIESKNHNFNNLQNLDSKTFTIKLDSIKENETSLKDSKILDSKENTESNLQDSKITQNIESKTQDFKNSQNLDSKQNTQVPAQNKKFTLIYNSYKNKEVEKILSIFKDSIDKVIVFKVINDRILPESDMQKILEKLQIPYLFFNPQDFIDGIKSQDIESKKALKLDRLNEKLIESKTNYLVFGSFSLAEQFLRFYDKYLKQNL